MKPNFTSQEILLITGTTFSSRQWIKNEETEKSESSSEHDMLQEACWNGLIGEMLPEISLKSTAADPVYLWKVHVGQSFIELELGKTPQQSDRYYSIDPYYFLELVNEN